MIRYIAACLIAAAAWFATMQAARAAEAMLVVQRPGEPEFVKHRYQFITTCTVDLPSEVYVQPKGTRLTCLKVEERKEAKAQ